MHVSLTVELLQSNEIAPLYERLEYSIEVKHSAGRYTNHMLVLFRRRLILELKREGGYEHADRSKKAVDATGGVVEHD